MSRNRFILLLLVLLSVWALADNVEISADSPKDAADLIIHNARVLTVDSKFSIVEAVAVRGGTIVAIGDSKTVLKQRGPKTRMIDAKGKTVLPGLYDSHTHPVGAV